MLQTRAIHEIRTVGAARAAKSRRLHLTPEEARRLIAAAGARRRNRFRDRVMLRMIYRHGLRACEACSMRWDRVQFDTGTLFVERLKGSVSGTHTLDSDDLRDLRKLRRSSSSPYVFVTERGGPFSVRGLQTSRVRGVENSRARRRCAPAHAQACGRVFSDQQPLRRALRAAIPRPQEHVEHSAIHNAYAQCVSERAGALTKRGARLAQRLSWARRGQNSRCKKRGQGANCNLYSHAS